MAKVKCSECGYLALWHSDHARIDEAPEEFRKTGEVPANFIGKEVHRPWPLCFARAVDIDKQTEGKSSAAIRKIVNAPRACDKFTDWLQGYSPREHHDMLQLDRQLEWQRKCEQDDREWRERCQREDRDWRERQARAAAWRHAIVILIAIVGAIAAWVGIWAM